MGFWNDVANFAVGAIEQDKANTKERFAIRAEELQANRASLLDRKNKRYEKDIENYYKEKEKFKAIESANADFAANKDAQLYAARILPITMSGWETLTKEKKDELISNYDGKTIDYKMKGSLDEIEQNAAMADAAITRYTSTALDDARGDRFLINKILGKKSKSEEEINKEMEAALKANNAIKLTETSVNPENVGLDVKATGNYGTAYKKFKSAKGSDKYQTEWSKQRDKISFGIANQEAFKFLETAKINGGGDGLSFKYDKKDGKIEGVGQPAIANINAMEYAFNTIKNNDDNMIDNFFNVDKGLYGTIGKNWNENVIYKKLNKTLKDRWGNIERGKITDNVLTLGLPDNVRLTTFVPLSLVNQNNNMIIGDTQININKDDMKSLSQNMNNFILAKAKSIKGEGDLQSKVQKVYRDLYEEDLNTLNEFISYYANENKDSSLTKSIIDAVENKKTNKDKIVDGDKLEKTETPKDKKTKTKSKTNYVVTKVDGKDGLAINGKFKSWEEIEAADAVKDLPEEQQNQFNQWKSSSTKE